MALHLQIALLSAVTLFVQTAASGCRLQFDRNSQLVTNPSNLRPNETLVCGLRESVITYFSHLRTEKMKDVGLDWDGARCYDEHTISFQHSEEHFKPKRRSWFRPTSNRLLKSNYDVEKHYLVMTCIGLDQILFTFNGILPSLGNKLVSEYIPSTQRYMTTLYVPFESIKSGNYTFQLINNPSSIQWFYVLIRTNQTRFWTHQTSGNVHQEIRTYEDPQDASKLVVPCKLNTFEIKGRLQLGLRVAASKSNILLSNLQIRFSEDIEVDDKSVVYDHMRGFIIEKRRLKEVIHSLQSLPRSSRDTEGATEIVCKVPTDQTILSFLFTAITKPSAVTVYFNRKFHLETAELNSVGTSLHLSMNNLLGSQKIECSSSHSPQYYGQNRLQPRGYISNVFILTISEGGLLNKCTWKDSSCDWNSHWLENGDSLDTTQSIAKNKKFINSCNLNVSQPCRFYNPYKSGLIRCATEGDEEFVTEPYFTGLDNRLYFVRDWNETTGEGIALSISLADFAQQETQVIYSNHATTFACTGVYFLLLPGYTWTLKLKNETVTDDLNAYLVKNSTLERNKLFVTSGTVEAETAGTHIEKITLRLTPDVKEIRCSAFLRDTLNKTIDAKYELNVKVKRRPEILSTYMYPNEHSPVIRCHVQAEPEPRISWIFNNTERKLGNFIENNGTFIRELTFSNSTENKFIPGNYTCVASNSEGNISHVFYVDNSEGLQLKLESSESSINIASSWIAGILALGFMLCIPAVIIFTVRQNRKNLLTKADVDQFLYGEKCRSSDDDTIYTALPYNHSIEVDLKDFTIDPTAVLGSGFYGLVLKAKLNGSDVAAKTLKTNSDRSVLLALLAEIKIMSYLEENPNIVSLLGAYTKELAKGRLYLFEEFCPLGSVESYLKTHKHLLMPESGNEQVGNPVLSLHHLRTWSFQIAQGMRYLSDCKVIHGDLAIRNLVLKDVNTIKITDFGLARQLQNNSIYKKTQEQPLPWRHMSPESLSANEFSVKSDVWAFGVTLWEMFSLGSVPYAGIQCAFGFAATLEEGLRLRKPPLCPNEIFSAMEKCWNLQPQERPDFHELCVNLMDILLASKNCEYLQIHPLPPASVGCELDVNLKSVLNKYTGKSAAS